MKNYAEETARAGIGRTPQLCQDALIEMLEELFEGRKFMGQEGRKPLKIIRQDIDIPEDDDEDVDTDISAAPYIKVAMTGGEIPNADSPQLVEFSLTICAYVAHTKEDIVQRVCTRPYFGGAFTILYPIAWAIQQDTSPPYYFAACVLTCTAPALTQDSELKGML